MSRAKRKSVPIYVGRDYRKMANQVAADRDVRPGLIVEEALRAAYGDPQESPKGSVNPERAGNNPTDGA